MVKVPFLLHKCIPNHLHLKNQLKPINLMRVVALSGLTSTCVQPRTIDLHCILSHTKATYCPVPPPAKAASAGTRPCAAAAASR
jgi:hypothetical protein